MISYSFFIHERLRERNPVPKRSSDWEGIFPIMRIENAGDNQAWEKPYDN